MKKLEILDRSQQCLKALIPDVWSPQMYGLMMRTVAGAKDRVMRNRV